MFLFFREIFEHLQMSYNYCGGGNEYLVQQMID